MIKKIAPVLLLLSLPYYVWSQTTLPTFEVNFENGLITSEGESPAISSNLTFENGISGQAVSMQEGAILQYPILNNINSDEGSLSLWVRPNWNPGELLYRILVLGENPRNFELHVDEGSQFAFAVNTWQVEEKPIQIAFASASSLQAFNWYHLAFNWSSEKLEIQLDGQKISEQTVGFAIPQVTEPIFHIGSLGGWEPFFGLMDEIKIYDSPLSPTEIEALYNEWKDNIIDPWANAPIRDAFVIRWLNID